MAMNLATIIHKCNLEIEIKKDKKMNLKENYKNMKINVIHIRI